MKNKINAAALLAAVMLLSACSGENNISDVADSSAQSSVTDSTSDSISDSSQDNSSDSGEESKPDDDVSSDAVVELSHSGGVYAEEFQLALTAPDGGEIYYTLDGSDPAVSDTAVQYSAPLSITDRKGDKNVVSAVDPVLIAGSFNEPNSSRDGFICTISAPSDNNVDKCTVVRAAVKNADGSFGTETAATYFIGTPEQHIQGLAKSCAAAGNDLAVISISMNYDDLFGGEKGIYVKGDIFDAALAAEGRVRDGETARSLDANYKQRGREWERTASMTMFEFNENGAVEVLNQTCGIRIQGNYSRSDLQKGLRLYARNEYGDNNFRYAVFGEEYLNDSGDVMDKFKTLVLRAGGNCAFTAKFNDTYWQSLLKETAVETKESRPCVVYLNGEYWGLYVLEEDYSDDYFEDLHGVNKDDVVVYKGDAETYALGYKLDEGELPEGEKEDYYFKELKDFWRSHSDLKAQSDYDEFAQLVDTDSVMDYFAAEIWINNKWDWPGKNWSMWKTIQTDDSNPYADGRWRFMFYDVEFGGVSGRGDAYANTIKDDNYKPKGLLDMDTNNPAVLCFAYLMTNDGWRGEFYDRLTGLTDGYFEKDAALARLKEFEDIYSPLYGQFFKRYPNTGSANDALNGGYASSACIREFINERGKNIQKMIDWCEKTLG
ncbi:MAG: CotH kinase family protein [Eubacterium sp.]|nr:CotH kinase family protein [Eubacterium sp.]